MSVSSVCCVNQYNTIKNPEDKVADYFKKRSFPASLKKDLAIIGPDKLTPILEAFFEDLIAHVGTQDPLPNLAKLADALSQEQLETVSEMTLAEVKEQLEAAKHYLEVTNDKIRPTFRALFSSFVDTLLIGVDGLLQAFGIQDFFKPPTSRFDNEFKFQKIMMLLSLFTMLTATLLPLLGVTKGASLVGGSIVLIMVVSLIWPHIRPRPSQLSEGENWSKEIRLCKFKPSGGRKGAMDKIYAALKEKDHPLLIGPSGVGKTQTIACLTKALVEGQYPELKDKEVFYFDTAALVNSVEMFQGGNQILKRIQESIGARHMNSCVLIFDELHVAYRDNCLMGDQLKILLDGKIPYFIGLTTAEEYGRFIYTEHAATDRRFVKVEIGNTDDEKTEAIMLDYLLKKGSMLIDDDVIPYILEQTRNAAQPMTALNIIKQCVTKTSKASRLPQEDQLEQLEEKRALLQKRTALTRRSHPSEQPAISKLKEEIATLKQEQSSTLKAKRRLHKVHEQFNRAIVQNKWKRALVLHHFCSLLERKIRRNPQGFLITKEIVDTILRENQQEKERAEASRQAGLAHLRERITEPA